MGAAESPPARSGGCTRGRRRYSEPLRISSDGAWMGAAQRHLKLALHTSLRCPGAASAVAAVCALVLSGGGAYAETDDAGGSAALTIVVTGLKSSEGQVRVAVFNGEDRWLKRSIYSRILDIKGHACELVIENVPHGDYGIAVFHDENGNGKNDRNFLGIPKEAYGFSNNARRKFGPPSWTEAKFAVSSSATAVEIQSSSSTAPTGEAHA